MVKIKSKKKLTIATVQNTKMETAIAPNSTRANMSIISLTKAKLSSDILTYIS